MKTVLAACLMVGVVVAADKPPKELPPGRALAGKTRAVVGKVEAWIESASAGDLMVLKIYYSTQDDAAKIDFTATQRHDFFGTDNHGNTYRKVTPELMGKPSRGFVSKGRYVEDWFVIEGPIGSAEFVDIDIPGAVIGEKEPFQFRIPKSLWEPKPAPKVVPKRK